MRSGLALIEVAPGIDIERDILAHMDFKPIISEPDLMDPRIFRPEPMGLETHLLNLDLSDRVTYDPQRNILFLNFVGMYIRVKDDIVALRKLLEERCKQIGKRVGVFVNYDGFRISEDTYDEYAEMDRYLLAHGQEEAGLAGDPARPVRRQAAARNAEGFRTPGRLQE